MQSNNLNIQSILSVLALNILLFGLVVVLTFIIAIYAGAGASAELEHPFITSWYPLIMLLGVHILISGAFLKWKHLYNKNYILISIFEISICYGLVFWIDQ